MNIKMLSVSFSTRFYDDNNLSYNNNIIYYVAVVVAGRRARTPPTTVALSVGRTRAPGHMVWPTNWILTGGPRDSVIPSRLPLSRPVANRTSRRVYYGIEGKK